MGDCGQWYIQTTNCSFRIILPLGSVFGKGWLLLKYYVYGRKSDLKWEHMGIFQLKLGNYIKDIKIDYKWIDSIGDSARLFMCNSNFIKFHC